MKDINLLIFDMDDTLINHGHMTKPAWIKTAEKMVDKFSLSIDGTRLGIEIGDVSESIFEDENKRPRGNYSPADLRYRMISEALTNLNISLCDECIQYMISEYDSIKKELVCVYDDVFDTLVKLRNKGYILALLTNGDGEFQRAKIKRFNLEPYVDYVFISGEMGVDKPKKEAYDMVCEKCGVKANEACMIGDNYLWEAVAPREYGLMSIWVNRVNKVIEDNKANYTIENISELLDIF